MSEWIEHDGKGMPVDGLAEVDVMYRDGEKEFGILAQSCGAFYDGDECWWSWQGAGYGTKIVAYRLSKANGDKDE